MLLRNPHAASRDAGLLGRGFDSTGKDKRTTRSSFLRQLVLSAPQESCARYALAAVAFASVTLLIVAIAFLSPDADAMDDVGGRLHDDAGIGRVDRGNDHTVKGSEAGITRGHGKGKAHAKWSFDAPDGGGGFGSADDVDRAWSKLAGERGEVEVRRLAGGMLLEHVALVLVPALAAYADADADGRVSREEFRGFVRRSGGAHQVATGMSAAVLAALEDTWGPSPANRGMEAKPCALENNPALKTFVEVAMSAEVSFGGSSPLCVEAWVKPTDAMSTPHAFQSYGGTIFAKYNDGVSGHFMLRIREDGQVAFQRETEPYGLYSRRRVPPNVYTHIAASYGFGKTAIFINGKEGKLKNDTYTPITIGGRLVHDQPGEQFTGLINEVRLWRQPCTADSVKQKMHERLVGWEEGLVGYWPMNECFGRSVRDKAGHMHGHLSGALRWSRDGQRLKHEDVELCRKYAKNAIDAMLQ